MSKYISEYEVKKLIVADFVNHTKDNKTIIKIIDSFNDILFEGRQQDLVTANGNINTVSELCDKEVESFQLGAGTGFGGTQFGIIELYV